MVLPPEGCTLLALSVQSLNVSVKVLVVPSVYLTVAVPDVTPLVAEPRKPRTVPLDAGFTGMICPVVWEFSGEAAGPFGQVNVILLDPTLVLLPGVSPAVCSACAE